MSQRRRAVDLVLAPEEAPPGAARERKGGRGAEAASFSGWAWRVWVGGWVGGEIKGGETCGMGVGR